MLARRVRCRSLQGLAFEGRNRDRPEPPRAKALSHSMHRIERFGLRQLPIDIEIPDMRKDSLNEAPTRELLRLQRHVEAARNPVQRFVPVDAGRPALEGEIIPGTGGARKRRFAGRGRGKSGGYRVISFYAGDDVPVLMLALIDKGERANISKAERNMLRQVLATYAAEYRAARRRRP